MLERFELGSCGLLERPLRLRYDDGHNADAVRVPSAGEP